MYIFNYVLVGFFINLCNSFILIHNQINSNFLLQHRKNKLNMSCDYYIDKDLHIYDYNNKEISYINIERERGYWIISALDEDEDGYDEQNIQYKKQHLQPSMKPIVIYSNNTFNKLSFENKYKKIIEGDLEIFNKTLNDVYKIIKIENRYERW
jgi:hypothetical protein